MRDQERIYRWLTQAELEERIANAYRAGHEAGFEQGRASLLPPPAEWKQTKGIIGMEFRCTNRPADIAVWAADDGSGWKWEVITPTMRERCLNGAALTFAEACCAAVEAADR